MNNRKLYLVAVVLGVCVAATVYAVLIRGGKTQQHPQRPQITTLPKMSSCVDTLPIQSAFLNKHDPNSDAMELVLQLMNNTDKQIVAVSVEWTSKESHTEQSLIINSFGADAPKILVEPHSLYAVTIPVENLLPDANVQVGSIIFADGTESGCANSLKSLHALKSKREKERPKKEPQL
jgi:hypothetical protein